MRIAGRLGGIAAWLPFTPAWSARRLARRGRAAALAARPRDAALLYEAALRLRPGDARLQIQCGHMRKEAGDLAAAEPHYLAALARLPEDADLALQLGHLYKVLGRREAAAERYHRALELEPGWAAAEHELAELRRIGPHVPEAQARAIGRLAPRLAPGGRDDARPAHAEAIELRRLGRREPGYWGMRRTLRGIEAIHGHAISAEPIVAAQVLVNGFTLHKGEVSGGYPLHRAAADDPHRKYVFNLWLDFTPFAVALHALELRLIRADGFALSFHEQVVIEAPLADAGVPGSDALAGADPVTARVRAAPSIVRPAARALFPDGVSTILVLRTDQLGDLIASIPALRRMREIAPHARIVGLLTAANHDLARTLGLFDEVIVVDFPDDPGERRRIMPLPAQQALRDRLAPYRFDIAVDLALSDVSRELLLLSGARFRYGFGGDWPWLSAEFMFDSHDRRTGLDIVPHSVKVLAMIEALGAALGHDAPVIRRAELGRDRLAPYGIGADERYAVLHMGARIAFSRWPHFPALAALLLAESDVKIVLLTDDPLLRATMPPALLASDRVLYLDRPLPFDDFDALLSFAGVVVGNDSGPKHLAALRGTNVVTLFTARVDWREWSQERIGTVISRSVPCQGCAIFHAAEECGRGFACITDIAPREVLDAVLAYI